MKKINLLPIWLVDYGSDIEIEKGFILEIQKDIAFKVERKKPFMFFSDDLVNVVRHQYSVRAFETEYEALKHFEFRLQWKIDDARKWKKRQDKIIGTCVELMNDIKTKIVLKELKIK